MRQLTLLSFSFSCLTLKDPPRSLSFARSWSCLLSCLSGVQQCHRQYCLSHSVTPGVPSRQRPFGNGRILALSRLVCQVTTPKRERSRTWPRRVCTHHEEPNDCVLGDRAAHARSMSTLLLSQVSIHTATVVQCAGEARRPAVRQHSTNRSQDYT